MTLLGLRLALAGGRGSAIALALAAIAVGLGTAVLLFALSFLPAVDDRTARDAWRSPVYAEDPFGDSGLMWLAVQDRYDGQSLVHVLVAPLADAPVLPGIPATPVPGQSYVSPALSRLLQTVPADQLGDRFGTVVGVIGDRSLRSPDELVAISGAAAPTILAAGGGAVVAFPTERDVQPLPAIALLLVSLAAAGALAPVAVFVATATRLSATRREQRLAALRLVGATTAQAVRLAAVEALAVTALGTILGVALFVVLRPLVARIPLDQTTWWPEAISPPLLPALLLLLAVPAVGAIAAVVSLRRVAISPLGLRQRTTPQPPRAARLLPLVVASVSMLLLVTLFRGEAGGDPFVLIAIGLAFAAVVGGIAYAGPWLTVLVGRGLGRLPLGGAATLLAARRLTDDPRGSFGAIAGVIMAVFVATAFLTFARVADTQAGAGALLEMQPGQVSARLPQVVTLPDSVSIDLAAIPGVTGVLPIRDAQVQSGDVVLRTWVTPCRQLSETLRVPALDCSTGVVAAPGEAPPGTGDYELVSDGYLPDGSGPAGIASLRLEPGDVTQTPPDWIIGRLPELIVDPSILGDAADTLPVTSFYVSTDGSIAAQERVRTVLGSAAPGAYIRTTGEQVTLDSTFDELGRVIVLGLFGTMALAGCSLAVAVTTSIADRRRQFALLRSAGMPASVLARLVLIQGGAPLVAVAAFSAGWAILVTQGLLGLVLLGSFEVPPPDASVLGVVAGSVALTMAVLLLALPLLERLTRPDTLRTE